MLIISPTGYTWDDDDDDDDDNNNSIPANDKQ